MNLKLLRGSLLEELGRICHATRGLGRMLSETQHAVGWQGALEEVAESEAGQLRDIQHLFDRFEAVIPENPGPAISGLLAEMKEDLCRQSGVYPPAALDFRLLAGLGRIVHYKLATLRSGIIVARLMEAHEVGQELERCLREEVENSRRLSELADDLLHLCGADSQEEIASALAGR